MRDRELSDVLLFAPAKQTFLLCSSMQVWQAAATGNWTVSVLTLLPLPSEVEPAGCLCVSACLSGCGFQL